MSLNKILKGKYPLGVYYESWSSNWASSPANLDLSKIPDPVNMVLLSFVNPNCSYKSGSNTLSGTGLDFSSDFGVVKGSIQLLRQRGIVVMLAVGGATYPFTTFNPVNIAALATDLGVDGVDIDWEPPSGAADAAKLGPIIQQMRSALPNGLLSLAGFSVGCYGQGEFANAAPSSGNTGMNIPGLQTNGKQLDFINLMSYDASPVYDPTIAFKAYRKYFSGPILIGAEVPPEAWGGHILTLSEVKTYANCALSEKSENKDKNQINGLFVWSYQKKGTPSSMDIINTASSILKSNGPTLVPTPVPAPPTSTPTPTPTPVNNWVAGKKYKKGQKVTYNGIKYTCNIDILSCPPNVNSWSAENNPNPTPNVQNWTVGATYSQDQIVKYNGQSYKCLQNHTAVSNWTPDAAPALWSSL